MEESVQREAVCSGRGSAFDEEVVRIASGVLASGDVEEIMRRKMHEGFESAIESAFKWGELRRAIENRVKDVLVPYVERYDMGAYVVKLDEVLAQIVEQSALADNRRLLENFKNLMVEPVEGTITLESLFDSYCEFVAENVDVSGLEVDTEDEPTYEPVNALAEVVEDERPLLFASSFENANLYLHVDGSEDLCFGVRLTRWKHDCEDGFTISYDAVPTVPGLSAISGFEVQLLRLQKSRVRLVCGERLLEASVTPNRTPDISFQ